MVGVINLTVHGIGRTDRALDPGEDLTWVAIDQFEQVLDAVAGRPDVRITFDDGNASDVEIALPRLLDRGLTGEFYVLAGLLDRPGRLTSDGVRELAESGMVIGSHGWDHRDWRRIDAAQAAREITHAGDVLSGLIDRPVSQVAIPFGSYDRHVLRRLRGAGVTRAYTSDGGRARPGAWLQARNSLPHDLDLDWIRQVIDHPPSPRARARGLAARCVKRVRG